MIFDDELYFSLFIFMAILQSTVVVKGDVLHPFIYIIAEAVS